MKLKLIIIGVIAWCLPLLLAGGAWSAGPQADGALIMLNVRGVRERGPVRFDHQAHQGRLNPAADWPYKASTAASCSGCHHSSNEQGMPQLWKCTVCHQTEGKGAGQYVNKRCGQQCDAAGNPKNCACDELYFERAFHDSCIGCHRASNEVARISKAPTTCSGCHAAR